VAPLSMDGIPVEFPDELKKAIVTITAEMGKLGSATEESRGSTTPGSLVSDPALNAAARSTLKEVGVVSHSRRVCGAWTTAPLSYKTRLPPQRCG